MKILIVKLSAFGDIVHALPILPAIRENIPSAEIFWAVDARFSELLSMAPHLSGVVPLPLKEMKSGFTLTAFLEALKKVRYLRSLDFDLCLDIQGNLKSGIVTLLAGSKLRYGFNWKGVRELPNLLFTNRKVSLENGDGHIWRKNLRIGNAALGIPVDFSLKGPLIVPGQEARENLAKKVALEEDGIKIAIHHGTTWETKTLSTKKWIDLLRALDERFDGRKLSLFLTWGNREEREKAERIREKMKLEGHAMSLNLAPSLTIPELAALFSSMDLVIGPDTGPLHLAAATGANTVSFYRVTSGKRNAPSGPGHRYLQAPVDCTSCLKKECKDKALCEESIGHGDLMALIVELVEKEA